MAERLIYLSRDKNGRFKEGEVSEHRKEWIGKRYGKLVVIDVDYGVQVGKKKRTFCKCLCDCGGIAEHVVVDLLSSGRKTSCGCDTVQRRTESQRKDLTGQRFGRLVVEEMLWVKPHTKCRCKCDCGNETVVINTGLTSGKTQSCGCYQSDRASESNTKDFTGQISDTGVKFIKRHKKDSHGVWIWECECPICHKHFYDTPAKVYASKISSCGCGRQSWGERYVELCLKELNANYQCQFSIADCKKVYPLRFDFAVLSNEGQLLHLIEFDGAQHERVVDWFGGEDAFLKSKERDSIKDEYCKNNNIPLTRLPYTMSFGEIKESIKNIINP